MRRPSVHTTQTTNVECGEGEESQRRKGKLSALVIGANPEYWLFKAWKWRQQGDGTLFTRMKERYQHWVLSDAKGTIAC